MARRKAMASGGGSDDDVNLTPMLDVVFILLIFFIVTAQFIKEPGQEIQRVDADNDANVKPLAILVAINEDSEYYMDKKLVEENELEFRIDELRKDNPKGELVVQVDSDSNAEALVTLMEILRDSDSATVVNISTAQD
ncbi:MAG: biopolymer transporter ExbD [Pseudomonadota bacterium]